MSDFLIAPSLLSADFARLGEDASKVIAAGADMLHLDVMDNHYVPNLTVGPLVCKALKEHGIKAPIDVHLMVKPVDSLITAFAKAGADQISIHPESTLHLDRSLSLIKSYGCKAGITLNPTTDLNCLDYTLDKLDIILLMSVNPGFGGQEFIPTTLNKISKVREIINKSGKNIQLAVDGGIKVNNIAKVASAGANMFIAGSAIFNQPDYATVIRDMRKELENTKYAKTQ